MPDATIVTATNAVKAGAAPLRPHHQYGDLNPPEQAHVCCVLSGCAVGFIGMLLMLKNLRGEC